MRPLFFTAADHNFLPGALALCRSVRTFYPEADFAILAVGFTDRDTKLAVRAGATVVRFNNRPLWPEGDRRNVFLWRYHIDALPDADYLVYMDADTVLTGRLDDLLSVPEGRLGTVAERYFQKYTIWHQFEPVITDEHFGRYNLTAKQDSFNCGVIAGSRSAWDAVVREIRRIASDDPFILHNSRTDQGICSAAVFRLGMHHDLSAPCNVFDDYWNGSYSAVLHFEGYDRPWLTGSMRKDNSYPAFKAWRRFSRISDFNGTARSETIWRALDYIRPVVRRIKH